MERTQQIPYVAPDDGTALEVRPDGLYRVDRGECVAPIVESIPRFVRSEDNYAESFGFQWNTWESARSDTRNPGHNLTAEIRARTGFDDEALRGKTLLECGMGGGDDTEVLLGFPLAELHAFDMSTSVNRANRFLKDSRLFIAQASIFEIPYPDASFDIVYCHRVLQHTPDPRRALQAICRKVKPGGQLFAHAYKRSPQQMSEWRYKYRWLTKRLPLGLVYRYVMHAGPAMDVLVRGLHRVPGGGTIAHRVVPWYAVRSASSTMSRAQRLEAAQHITFDALTPWHDHPMTTEDFRGTIEAEGFTIEHLNDPVGSPLWCTARRAR